MIKCSASLAIYLFSLTCLINSIIHEHSYKIFYVRLQLATATSKNYVNLHVASLIFDVSEIEN